MLYERNLNLLKGFFGHKCKSFWSTEFVWKNWVQKLISKFVCIFSNRGTVSRMRGLFSPARVAFSHCRVEEWIINRLLTVPQTPENWRNYLKIFALFTDCELWSIFGAENLIDLAFCPPDREIQPTREQLLIFGNIANWLVLHLTARGRKRSRG